MRAGDRAQAVEQCFARHAAQREDEEGVAVEFLAEQIIDRRDMFAWVGPIRAGAVGGQIAVLGRKERRAGGLKNLFDLVGHLAGEQLGQENRPSGKFGDDAFPLLRVIKAPVSASLYTGSRGTPAPSR